MSRRERLIEEIRESDMPTHLKTFAIARAMEQNQEGQGGGWLQLLVLLAGVGIVLLPFILLS